MKKKRITYGVYGMMEYQAIIKVGKATLKVLFTDGSITAMGQNPAQYTTSDFIVQHAIENSSDFKRGRIHVVNTIELDEEVHIERNPAKPSTQTAQTKAEAKPVVQNVSKTEDVQGITGEPTEYASAGIETPTPEVGIEPIEDEPKAESETGTAEEDTSDEATSEDNASEAKTEVEFTDNQEAKDYLLKNFGVKPGTMRNRDDIKAVGETYGVKITFVNENK